MYDGRLKDRRRYKRLPIKLHLEVDEVFKQDNVVLKGMGASITVVDISKSGIGFISDANLPVGYYFGGTLDLGDNDMFHVVIQIVRATIMEKTGQICYGAEFVGLAPFLAEKVDRYEKRLQKIL